MSLGETARDAVGEGEKQRGSNFSLFREWKNRKGGPCFM